MPEKYKLLFHPDFFTDIKKFTKREKEEISKHVNKIKESPERTKHLHGKGNCYSLRAGTIRIIYSVQKNVIILLIVSRRKEVYDSYSKRLYNVQRKLE